MLKSGGPWHAHEIKEWMGREVECLPHLQAYRRVLDSLQANSVPHNGAPVTGGVGWPASSGPHTFAPQTGGLVYPHGSMPPTMLGANCYGSLGCDESRTECGS